MATKETTATKQTAESSEETETKKKASSTTTARKTSAKKSKSAEPSKKTTRKSAAKKTAKKAKDDELVKDEDTQVDDELDDDAEVNDDDLDVDDLDEDLDDVDEDDADDEDLDEDDADDDDVEDDEDEEGSGGVRRLESLLDELEPLCWPAPLNEDETGSADEALLPAALFVEPGTRLGGKTISRLREAALERDLMPLAPCTHRAPCPLAHAHAGRGWCHFTFDCEGAPQWLQELSSAAGLAKSALSLAPLLLRADPAAGESLFDDMDDFDDEAPDNSREAVDMLRQPRPVRVLSSPFVVPGLRGQARYACCAAGLAVVPDAAALPSGAQLTARAQADEHPGTPRRDRKSGALLLALPAVSGGSRGPGRSASPEEPRRNVRDRQEDRYGDRPFGRRPGERDGQDGSFRDRRNGSDRPPRRDDRREAPERPARHQDRRPGRYEDGRPDRRDDPRAFPRNDRRPDGRRPGDRRSGDRRQGDASGRGRGRGED